MTSIPIRSQSSHAAAHEAPAQVAAEQPAVFESRDRAFTRLFDTHFARIARYVDRISGDPELAADVTQEAFIRLYKRGALPDRPAAWLITVALNLVRNAVSQRSRRRVLMSPLRATHAAGDPAPAPDAGLHSTSETERVRHALDALPVRERSLLLLRTEGYSYRELADALDIRESSVGTLLARARDAFRVHYEEASDAS
jgi:RNA polymerase sigma factor (sigma-70 family)